MFRRACWGICLFDELLDFGYCGRTVGRIGDTEPLGCSVKNFHRNSAIVDELVHHQGNEELCFQILDVLLVREEVLEVLFTVVEVVGCEAPHIHAHGSIVGYCDPFAFFVLIAYVTVDTHDLGALHNSGQVLGIVLRADATGYGTVLAQCVANAESYHSVFVLCSFGQIGQILTDHHESVTVVEVIAVDHAERLVDDILCHQYGVICAPWLLAAFRNSEALGQCVKALEAELGRDVTLIFGEDLRAELLFEVFADDKDNFAEAGLNSIINTVVHDRFTVGTQAVELLETTVTAAHAGSQKQ